MKPRVPVALSSVSPNIQMGVGFLPLARSLGAVQGVLVPSLWDEWGWRSWGALGVGTGCKLLTFQEAELLGTDPPGWVFLPHRETPPSPCAPPKSSHSGHHPE